MRERATLSPSSRPHQEMQEPGQWHMATVLALGERLHVRRVGASGVLLARQAAGALLQPQVGDTVLLAIVGADCWVTLVLTRQADRVAQLAVPGATAVDLCAPALTLRANGALAFESEHLQMQARRTTAFLGTVRLSAHALHVVAQRLAIWADLIQTRAHALVVRAEQRVSKIDRNDVLQAAQVVVESEQLLQFKGRQIQVQAQETVLIDGKRILMG